MFQTLPSLMLSLQKKRKRKNPLLSFHSSIFYSKKFICILHVKWTGMNKGEQVENLKFWVNILFEWPQSLFAATKIYLLIFNSTNSLISLMGSFHFPQCKIFFPIHWQILKILGEWNISIIYFKSEMSSSSFMWILHLIFNSEA